MQVCLLNPPNKVLVRDGRHVLGVASFKSGFHLQSLYDLK